jgi:hypothetical protein
MKYSLKIEVDTNDGDYISEITVITSKQLEQLRPLFAAIKRFVPYKCGEDGYRHDNNFPYGDCCREDMGELPVQELYKDIDPETLEYFIQLCPFCEYGFHTIESVEVAPEVKWEKLV